MDNGKTYQGSCFCGAVQFTVSGEPAAVLKIPLRIKALIFNIPASAAEYCRNVRIFKCQVPADAVNQVKENCDEQTGS